MAIRRIRRYQVNSSSSATLLISFSLFAVMLSGCSSKNNATLTAPPTASPASVLLGPTSTLAITQTPADLPFPTATLLPIPAIDNHDHATGDPGAPITLLVYSDFQCPFCADFFQAWKQIQALHPRQVRLIFRHFPLLPIHDKADLAGAVAEIASQENRFWEMHDTLFERQNEWVGLDRDGFIAWIIPVIGELELDTDRFLEELSRGEALEAMKLAYEAGVAAGIPGTPFIFMNGDWYRINPNAKNLEASIRLELLSTRQYPEAPQYEFIDGTLYFARVQLDQGEILLQLYPEQAPATVASFIFLAEQGWYDGIGIHHVRADTLIEAGDPTGTGLGGPGYLLFDELSETLTFDEIGMLAMSSSGPNTNGSRFFINLVPLPNLNGARTIFGRVIRGLDLLSGLNNRDALQDLFEPYELVIDSIRIEKR